MKIKLILPKKEEEIRLIQANDSLSSQSKIKSINCIIKDALIECTENKAINKSKIYIFFKVFLIRKISLVFLISGTLN